MNISKAKIILALDGMTATQAVDLVCKIASGPSGQVFALKIQDLYYRSGAKIISNLKLAHLPIWVDVKLHDIPETVENCAAAIKDNGADILTVHASGGIEMMEAAKKSGLIVYGVTVLTSIDEAAAMGLHGMTLDSAVRHLANSARLAGLDGVVCSSREVKMLAEYEGAEGLEFIVPGIRSLGIPMGDQKRVDTPLGALQSGATRLVVGRQITKAANPNAELKRLYEEIDQDIIMVS